jgi:hypothetical protein
MENKFLASYTNTTHSTRNSHHCLIAQRKQEQEENLLKLFSVSATLEKRKGFSLIFAWLNDFKVERN